MKELRKSLKPTNEIMFGGSRHIATEALNGEILFDGFGTSKALDNPYFQQSLHLFAAQEGYRDLVLFNNGLHGWHLSAA